MILVWKGLGIVVVVIWVGAILAGDALAKVLFGPEASRGLHNLTVQWLAAAVTLAFAIGVRAHRKASTSGWDRPLDEPGPTDSLFWIPVIVWPAVFFVLGIVVYFK